MARRRAMVAWGLAALLCLALRIAPATAATSATFTSTADTMLDSFKATQNNGTCVTNLVNVTSARASRILVQFDVSTITTLGDAAIKTANLNLVQTAAGTDATKTFNAHRVTSAWAEGDKCGATCATTGATWNNSNLSNCTTAWTTAGGVFNSTATASVTNVSSTSGTTVTWNIRADVQPYVLGTVTNNGTLIKDSLETATGTTNAHTFGMKENTTVGNRPTLAVSYLRQVTNLVASASSGQNVVNWSLPNTTDYNGALVVRKATTDFTSNASSNPVDTTAYVAGNTIGDGTVVCNITTATTTSCTDTGLTNGTTYFYRVYARDSSVNYSASAVSGSDPTYPKTNATPPDGVTQKYNWDYITGATTLAPPGLTPNGVVVSGSNTSKLYGMSASNGTQSFTPFATGNAIQARPPVIPTAFSTLALNVAYVTSQDGFAYATDTSNGTQVWKSASLGTTLQGGTAVWLQAIKALTVTTPPQPDLVVVGTRNTGSTTNNKIYGLHGELGTTLWTFNSGLTNSVDAINSTPYIDYAGNRIWVSSLSAGGTSQPSLWKLNAANGALDTSFNLGNITSSPSATLDATVTTSPSFIYVGTDAGDLKAIKVSDNTVISCGTTCTSTGTTAVQGFPLSFSFSTPSVSTPDTIVYTKTNTVQAVSFNGSSFGSLWTTTVTGASAPQDDFNGTKVYVGASDGKVHQLNRSTGVDEAQVSTLATQTVGDPSFDVTLSRTYVGAADGRIYSFTSPF